MLHVFIFLVILLFKMPPKHSAEVLSSFPKYKDALMCLTGEKCVLERLHPGMSYIAIGHEFSVMY